MRRKWLCSGLAGAGLLTVLVVWLTSQSGANQNNENGNGKKAPDPLPIRQVVLFNSGVGYFQREGTVDGNTRVDLSFPTSDINDLLKSLILQDLGGGRISTVNYDSHDPIDKTLRSFAIDLNSNPTFGQILNQARGEKIEVTRLEKKEPVKVSGVIVGMETQKKPVADKGIVEVEILNLNTDKGLQSIDMDQVLAVKFLDARLQSELQRALTVLARSHDTMKKTVSLGFNGVGPRAVRVGYVVERPIWKTSYRLRMDPNGKVYLQGWALVENTSDDDWNDVRMVLVSGKPISYQMNLYEPLYIPRPFVEPEYFASLRPPVYTGAMEPSAKDMADAKGAGKMPTVQLPVPGQGGFGGGQFGQGGGGGQFGQGGFGGGGFQGGSFQGGFNGQFGQFGQFGQGGFNGGWGMFNNDGMNRFQQQDLQRRNEQALANSFNKLTYDELQARRAAQTKGKADAKDKGPMIAMNFKEGIQSVATAEEVGDYHQFILDQKITLPRQKSAMLPILEQNIDGQKVSIFNESTHAKHPLLGLRLKNTSGQPLTQGPITVYDAGLYAGDTRVLDLQVGEERLLSYALDQGTEVKTAVKKIPSPDMHFKIGEAQLTATYKMRETRTYTIKNRSTHDRSVIVEHAIRPEWKLVEGQKPNETARSVYRFNVAAPAGKTVTLDVVEDQKRLDQIALTKSEQKPHYAIGLGIEVKQLTHVDKEKLTGLKIQKGFLLPTYKVKESRTYFVQNLSEENRTFQVDHIVRQDWVRLDKDDQRGPAVFRFTLKVDKGKTGQQEVSEERTFTIKDKLVKEFGDTKIKEYLNSAVPSAEVKAALTKVQSMEAKIAETRKTLAALEKQHKIVNDDQARLRSNLQVIPQSNPVYQKFLDKFLAQENQIEDVQKQMRNAQTTLTTQEREFELFIAALNGE